MKLAGIVLCLLALTARRVFLVSGNNYSKLSTDLADVSRRVALCFSGRIEPFANPLVHRSIRYNVIEAMENNAERCQVDVFAYGVRYGTQSGIHKAGNADFTRGKGGDLDNALKIVNPVRVVWHKDQAGLIPNSCLEETYGWVNESADGASSDSQQGRRRQSTRNLYWKLYQSLAVYRMVREAEREGHYNYDWVVHMRFDLAWVRPLPPLRYFSRGFVWFSGNRWPVSDHFAIVPRGLCDDFFGAITAFYACDGSSWPPPSSWWQPDCQNQGFEESVPFRHLHATNVPYRFYSMFEFVQLTDGEPSTESGFEASDAFHTACGLLAAAKLLQPSFQSVDCATALAAWAGLRRRTLLPAAGTAGAKRVEAIIDPRPRAWDGLVGSLAEGGALGSDNSSSEGLGAIRLKLVALRDAVLLRPSALDGIDFDLLESMESGRIRCSGIPDAIPLWRVHSQRGCPIAELGVCTADASLGLSVEQHVERSFTNPATPCVGYGRLAIKSFEKAKAEDVVQSKRPSALLAPRASAGKVHLTVTDSSVGAEAVAEEVDQRSKSSPHSDPSLIPSACLDLEVKAMTVVHPANGAVYWEGPVEVELYVTLTGAGLRGIDLQHVQACADIEESWPIQDWSRTCVTLKELESPNPPFLVFGSVLGVVLGSVGIFDARPSCILEGEERGRYLSMAGGIARERFRFKIIHHGSTLRRRGRPLGFSPSGRGLITTEDFVADLEREADADLSAAVDEMQTYLNITSSGHPIPLRGDRCTSRLDLHERGTSLVATGFQLQFIVEQLDWMIANGKLPKGMQIAIDRMREVGENGHYPKWCRHLLKLQAAFPGRADANFFRPFILADAWRAVAPFFQKALLFPEPRQDQVVSTMPLHTWEYDEIPWMEALNPAVDWNAVEEAYLGNEPVPITRVDDFFSSRVLDLLLDMVRGTTIFFDNRRNYIGAYPSDGMSHPLLYQIAEEAAERLPRIVGRGTKGWPLVQMWFYIYGGNDGERCTLGIGPHADSAAVNLNVWLAPDSANLGSAETNDAGGLTVFHARPPDEWRFSDFNRDPVSVEEFLRKNDAGNTSVPQRQNRALLFDSMLFHQSDPFRFKKGFENRRINLTLLFGAQHAARPPQAVSDTSGNKNQRVAAAKGRTTERTPPAWHPQLEAMREISPGEATRLRYCL